MSREMRFVSKWVFWPGTSRIPRPEESRDVSPRMPTQNCKQNTRIRRTHKHFCNIQTHTCKHQHTSRCVISATRALGQGTTSSCCGMPHATMYTKYISVGWRPAFIPSFIHSFVRSFIHALISVPVSAAFYAHQIYMRRLEGRRSCIWQMPCIWLPSTKHNKLGNKYGLYRD